MDEIGFWLVDHHALSLRGWEWVIAGSGVLCAIDMLHLGASLLKKPNKEKDPE